MTISVKKLASKLLGAYGDQSAPYIPAPDEYIDEAAAANGCAD